MIRISPNPNVNLRFAARTMKKEEFRKLRSAARSRRTLSWVNNYDLALVREFSARTDLLVIAKNAYSGNPDLVRHMILFNKELQRAKKLEAQVKAMLATV